MRLEPARSGRNLQSYCSARARTQTYHSRARGYKKAVSSSSLIIDGGSGGAGLELAKVERTRYPGRGAAAAGLELAQDERGPGAAAGVELAEDKLLVTGLDGPRQYRGAGGAWTSGLRQYSGAKV